MQYELDDLAQDQIEQAANVWLVGWHDAHADIVPPSLTALRTIDSFRQRLVDYGGRIRIGKTQDGVMGFCMTHDDELYQLYVSAAARGTGMARDLILDAETSIASRGHARAWLSCAADNARAARFYEKSGWVNMGARMVDLDTSAGKYPLECWRFEKVL